MTRKEIYYWKSDRPYAIANTQSVSDDRFLLERQLINYLKEYFVDNTITIKPAGGQGNHITYFMYRNHIKYFVRLENGPERDNYMSVESAVIKKVKDIGVPVPAVYLTDTSRRKVPFAIQIMECIDHSDLNVMDKRQELDTIKIANAMGQYIALWQTIRPKKYGLFNIDVLAEYDRLEGYHDRYEQYFFLNWDKHLDYLSNAGFINENKVLTLKKLVNDFRPCLQLEEGCLVHKDLAFWNVLGEQNAISAIIDWDDAISGDPMDDLSLLGCFHSGEEIISAIGGYKQVRSLPENYEIRFWLHLLRNIIFKSVIRVKGGYFDKADSFFLSNPRNESLRSFTLERIESACEGLKGNKKIQSL